MNTTTVQDPIDQMRVEACDLIRKAIVVQGGIRLARIFDLWRTIEIMKVIGDYAGYTEPGRSVLNSSAEKLKEILKAESELDQIKSQASLFLDAALPGSEMSLGTTRLAWKDANTLYINRSGGESEIWVRDGEHGG